MKKTIWAIFFAVACASAARADDFTWIGGDTGKWNDAGNWSKTSGTSTRKYPSNKADNATVDKTVAINFTGNGTVGQITLDADVTFTGGKYVSVYSGVVGTGTLTLSGASLRAAASGEVPISLPLVMADGTENELQNTISASVKAYFVVTGPLRGKGAVSIHATTASYAANVGTILKGDNSEFGGVVRMYPYASATSNQSNDRPQIYSGAAAGAAAQWEFNVQQEAYGETLYPGAEFFGTPNETYKFGSLKANFYYTDSDNAYWAAAGITLEVGGRNEDGYAKGVCVPKDGVIDWIAESATFTNEVSGLARLRLLGGGKLVIGSDDGVPAAITFADNGGELSMAVGVTADLSAAFRDSTVPVVFNDNGSSFTWSTGPDASNIGGFVKRGSGTLTWSSAPASPIDVTVEQGTLVVPFGAKLGRVVIADGAVLKINTTGKSSGIAFVAASSDRPLDETRLVFDPEPAATVTVVPGADNGAAYVIGSKDYVWRGTASSSSWSTPANWNPTGVPQEQDKVTFAAVSTSIVDQASAALTVGGAESVWFGGSYALSVALQMALEGELTLEPNPMSGKGGADAYGAANRLGVSAGALAARSISGEGFVTAIGSDLTGGTEAGMTNGFVGTLTGRNFTKRGAGVYKFIGEGAFSGTVAVEEGTLLLGTYCDLDNVRYDFDASDTASLTGSGGAVTEWKSRVNGYVFKHDAGQEAAKTVAYFGGKNTLYFRPSTTGDLYSRYVLAPNNVASGCASKSLFFVYRPIGFISGRGRKRGYLYGQAEFGGMSVYSSELWEWRVNQQTSTDGVFTGNDYGSYPVSDEIDGLMFWSDAFFDMGAGHDEQLGTMDSEYGFSGAIAEVVAFTNTLTQVEREVTTKQLMRKWGLGYADYLPLRKTVRVTMKAGATLDLGGQTVEVSGFEGAGVVTNGLLKTVRVVQRGGALSIPANEGSTYVLSQLGEKLVLTGAAGKHVNIEVPCEWARAGRSGKMAVYCEGSVAWDFSEWIGVKPKPVYENGWWSIPAGGTAVRLQ